MHHRAALVITAYGVFEALARLHAFPHDRHGSSVQQPRAADEAFTACGKWVKYEFHQQQHMAGLCWPMHLQLQVCATLNC